MTVRFRSGSSPALRRWARAGVGVAGLLVTAAVVHEDRVGPVEAPVFRLVNELPDGLAPAVWPVMQLGALGAVPVVAGAVWVAGERRLAVSLLATGTASWALSKVVKRLVRRPRPAVLLATARSRGATPAGLGFVSGHAAVATALAAGLLRRYPAGRPVAAVLVPVVGLSRVYVGAHLPLDVLGGVALGLTVDAFVGSHRGDPAPVG